MAWRIILIFSLISLSLAAFLLTAAFLPRAGEFGWSSPLEWYMNSRRQWDIAWTVFVAALAFSLGLYGLVEARASVKRGT